jgi:hypothetical protein
MSSAVTTFVHLMIALVGASASAYGAQKVGEDKKNSQLYDKCIKQTVKKGSSKSAVVKACDKAYGTGGIMGKVLMYGGCGFIILAFIVISLMDSSFFGGGYGGYGGGGYQQQF